MDMTFSTGTCTKGNLYSTILTLLKNGGWTAINTKNKNNKTYNAYKSTGETGDKSLVVLFDKVEVDTTTGNIANIKLLKSCSIHNEGGSAGNTVETWTFDRNKEPFVNFMLAPSTLATDAIIEYKYNVNKDRLILILYYPSWTNFKSVVHYIGIPDNVFLDNVGNNELLYASSLMKDDTQVVKSEEETEEEKKVYRGFSWVIDAPYGWPVKSTSEKNYSYTLLPPKSPNASNKYMLSKPYYGTEVYGIRGEFSGLYITKDESIYPKELIKIEDKTFEVCVCHEVDGYVNSFGSSAIAYEIDKTVEEAQLLQSRINLETLKSEE